MTRYARPMIRLLSNTPGVSAGRVISTPSQEKRAKEANWRVVRMKMSRPSEYLDTATMWAAKKKPPMRVSTSPMLKAEALSPVMDTRAIPPMHRKAAIRLNRSGRRLAMNQYRKGTMTQ